MNIKLRFAILFTSFVLLILILSSVTIYFLYANFRVQEYYARINKEALFTYNRFIDNPTNTQKIDVQTFQAEAPLLDFFILVYDSTYKRIYQSNDSLVRDPQPFFFKSTFQKSETRFTKNGREALMLYFANTGNYVFASAYDKYGLRKLKNIQLILMGVLLGGFIISIIAAFVFVKHAFKPLKLLSNQMVEIQEINSANPILIANKNDEIEQIALSYNAMIERLKKAFEYQKVFIDYASHELRTPLAIMLSQTEAALNNNLNANDLKNVLLSLKEDQQETIDLTNALLSLSLFDKNGILPHAEQVRIDELIYECIEHSKKTFNNIEISFNFVNVPEESHLLQLANKSLLKTAIKNLIKNGFQYSYDKKIKVNLFVNAEIVEITVENSGKEVPQEQRDHLFVPFFRAQNVDMEMGYGLGLAIVLRIVQAHNGAIIYKVCDTGRNCFTIQLQKQKPVE